MCVCVIVFTKLILKYLRYTANFFQGSKISYFIKFPMWNPCKFNNKYKSKPAFSSLFACMKAVSELYLSTKLIDYVSWKQFANYGSDSVDSFEFCGPLKVGLLFNKYMLFPRLCRVLFILQKLNC
jgi:hypothetical protein